MDLAGFSIEHWTQNSYLKCTVRGLEGARDEANEAIVQKHIITQHTNEMKRISLAVPAGEWGEKLTLSVDDRLIQERVK